MDAKTSEAVEESTFSSCTRRLKLSTEEFVRGESTRERQRVQKEEEGRGARETGRRQKIRAGRGGRPAQGSYWDRTMPITWLIFFLELGTMDHEVIYIADLIDDQVGTLLQACQQR